ncbi:hypothetical protein RF11_01313 [Thelohanellus kitauei]|uniref:Uncharacterized protein n=1 Tax=Thelohanellus kitauei TaxID=669202 RepID=A0A0C2JA30_THEKT|nr:hypothetical protein RF11_01313 [Thelohanellus kitauei]
MIYTDSTIDMSPFGQEAMGTLYPMQTNQAIRTDQIPEESPMESSSSPSTQLALSGFDPTIFIQDIDNFSSSGYIVPVFVSEETVDSPEPEQVSTIIHSDN